MGHQQKEIQSVVQPKISEIARFFDEMSVDRNRKIQSNPIINYEQQVLSRTVLVMLSPSQGEKILDIGCGNARDLAIIAATGAQVVGVDIAEGMVSAARQELIKLGIESVLLRVGDAKQLDFADGEFDKVLCSEVIEHIPDAEKALAEIWRVLKPGVVLVLSTPNPKSWYRFDRYWIWERVLRKKWNHPFDQWRTMSDLISLVEHKGFKVGQKPVLVMYRDFSGLIFSPRHLPENGVGWCAHDRSGSVKTYPAIRLHDLHGRHQARSLNALGFSYQFARRWRGGTAFAKSGA